VLTQGGAATCRGAQATDGGDKAQGRRGNHMFIKNTVDRKIFVFKIFSSTIFSDEN
jgi:hypothetical protein